MALPFQYQSSFRLIQNSFLVCQFVISGTKFYTVVITCIKIVFRKRFYMLQLLFSTKNLT